MRLRMKTLLDYRSRSHPYLVFYYSPLSRIEQDAYRADYPRYGSPYKLLSTVLGERLLLVQDDRSGVVDFLTSPDDPLWDSFPRSAVLEAGAAVLGWSRLNAEDGDAFVGRVRRELDATVTGAV